MESAYSYKRRGWVITQRNGNEKRAIWIDGGRYPLPHQSKREKARRLRQLAAR